MADRSAYDAQVRLLVQVLPLLGNEPDFALKGGTALNLFVHDLPRLSVDIDLAYLPISPRADALREITAGLERIAMAAGHIPGTSAQRLANRDDELRIVISNANATVKVEVSPVIRGTLEPPVAMDICAAGEREYGFAAAQVLALPDLYGGKICAALTRQHPRDLFDAHLLLQADMLDRSIFEGFLVYLLSHPRPMAEVLSPRWKDVSAELDQEFQGMTTASIDAAELSATGPALLEALRGQATAEDADFLLSVKLGQPDWDLAPAPHVASLPAVRWKLENIRRMRDDKRSQAYAQLQAVLEQWR